MSEAQQTPKHEPSPSGATGADRSAARSLDAGEAESDRAPSKTVAPNQSKKPALVPAKSNKLGLPQSLKRTRSVAKVAGSKLLRDTGEGLVGFSEWLEGRTSEGDQAEAAAVQENLEERFEGSWQKWGGFLDQLKSPLPKKIRRIPNSRLTGFLVGILVFLFLALSSAFSGSAAPAKDADTPLIQRSNRPSSSKLIQSRGSEDPSSPAADGKAEPASPKQTKQTSTPQKSNNPASKSDAPASGKSKKSISAANFFGEESPRQAPPLNRPAAPKPAAATRATAPAPGNSATAAAPNPAPYGGYPMPGYPQPGYPQGYGQPPLDASGNPVEAIAPAAYPPPYPYPPYFYAPPPGYPGGADGSSPATPPGQANSPGQPSQPSPYGGYAPYPYPYPYPAPYPAPYPTQPAVTVQPADSGTARPPAAPAPMGKAASKPASKPANNPASATATAAAPSPQSPQSPQNPASPSAAKK